MTCIKLSATLMVATYLLGPALAAAAVPSPGDSGGASAAAAARMSTGLKRCLQGCPLVDGSNRQALEDAGGARLWALRWSTQVPLGVVYPRSTAEVAKAVRCARQAGAKATARSGGGSFLGYSVREGTLTIDLTRMGRVAVAVDKASVDVQGGTLLGRLYYEVWRQAGDGYAAAAGHCPNVGVGGHLLAGGLGFLSPQFGLSCDSLLSLEMVTADRQVAKRVHRKQDVPLLDRATRAVQEVMAPLVPGQPAYLGYVDDKASGNPLASYYGANLGWLRQVRNKYDPSGFFAPLSIPPPG